MTPAVVLVAGVATGLHAASWGAYKDSKYEGFRPRSYLRSVVVGVLVAAGFLATGVAQDQPLIAVVGLLYTGERLLTEFWKTILRVDDQSAYTIPMRLAVNGRTVENVALRYTVGLVVLVGFFAVVAAVAAVDDVVGPLPQWLLMLLGGVGGWFIACGGAWKDAPIEGFSLPKFFRSPVVATAWAVVMSNLVDDWTTLILASGGLSVASIETYKTFLTRDKAPGKFADKAALADRLPIRERLAKVFASLWLALCVGLLVEAAGQPAAQSGREAYLTSTVTSGFLAVFTLLVGIAVLAGHALNLRAADERLARDRRSSTTG